jgi:hypothetical protein
MEQARIALHDAINYHDADDLRNHPDSRAVVKSKVDEILSKFNF